MSVVESCSKKFHKVFPLYDYPICVNFSHCYFPCCCWEPIKINSVFWLFILSLFWPFHAFILVVDRPLEFKLYPLRPHLIPKTTSSVYVIMIVCITMDKDRFWYYFPHGAGI